MITDPSSEEIAVISYKGRDITQFDTPTGQVVLHYFEGKDEYGLMCEGGSDLAKRDTLRILKSDIDDRDQGAMPTIKLDASIPPIVAPSFSEEGLMAADRAFVQSFNFQREQVYKCSVEHGWWESGDRNEGELIALCHSELSEALEALRHGNPPDDKIPAFSGAEAEFADVIIRIMDHAKRKNYRIAEAVVAKIAFNFTRPHKHGGKKF